MSHHMGTRTKFKSTPSANDNDIQKELNAVEDRPRESMESVAVALTTHEHDIQDELYAIATCDTKSAKLMAVPFAANDNDIQDEFNT
eukprot:3293340-Amphidinium_carterae.1